MKLSELRKALKRFEKERGDLNVYFQDDFGDLYAPSFVTDSSRPFGADDFEDFAMIKCNHEAN